MSEVDDKVTPADVAEDVPPQDVDEQMLAAMDEALADDEAQAVDVPTVQEPGETVPAVADTAQVEPVKDAEAEIADLKLGDRAATRFREMSGEIRDLKSALETAGVKDIASLPQALERAKAADDMIAMVMDTGATAEQYGETLDYLRLVNAAKQGDVNAAQQAFTLIEREYHGLAKALGKRVDGVDPLAEHEDLRAKIEAGALDEADALEIARLRTHQQAQQQHQQHAQQEAQQTQAVERGRNLLAAWDQQMLAADPTYAGKRDALSQQVAVIRSQLPPDRWLAATQQLYAALPTIQPQAPHKPTPGPVRPGRVTAKVSPKYETPEAAIDAALDEF